LRGYPIEREIKAFQNVLKTGGYERFILPDPSSSGHSSLDTPRWTLSLSLCNWLLAILRSKTLGDSETATPVKNLDVADSIFLHELQAEIDTSAATTGPLQRLSQLVRGELTYEQYSQGSMLDKDSIRRLMERMVAGADVVMTTPAGAQVSAYHTAWSKAMVIAIDEAGYMHKADLCSIWGNTLRPIILAGDIKQLPPTMMEFRNQHADGTFLNRFALTGRISALGWIRAQGWPSFRLLRQLRMAKNMFHLAQKLFYKDHVLQYGPGTDPSLECHAAGIALEKYIAGRGLKHYKACKEGVLLPVFLHVPDLVCEHGRHVEAEPQAGQGNTLTLSRTSSKKTGISPSEFCRHYRTQAQCGVREPTPAPVIRH
jgi:hypothetical protein